MGVFDSKFPLAMAIEDYLTLAEPTDEVIETDAVIVGAGPVGLFSAVPLNTLFTVTAALPPEYGEE